jgi:hypothetical protein
MVKSLGSSPLQHVTSSFMQFFCKYDAIGVFTYHCGRLSSQLNSRKTEHAFSWNSEPLLCACSVKSSCPIPKFDMGVARRFKDSSRLTDISY